MQALGARGNDIGTEANLRAQSPRSTCTGLGPVLLCWPQGLWPSSARGPHRQAAAESSSAKQLRVRYKDKEEIISSDIGMPKTMLEAIIRKRFGLPSDVQAPAFYLISTAGDKSGVRLELKMPTDISQSDPGGGAHSTTDLSKAPAQNTGTVLKVRYMTYTYERAEEKSDYLCILIKFTKQVC